MLHTSLTDPLTEPPITYPTRRLRAIFLQKNNSKTEWSENGKKNWVEEVVGKKMAAVFLVELDGVVKADPASGCILVPDKSFSW